jgi:pyruvate/2-oxoglutarate/acetoin dehydrogenase E1 component
VRLGAPFAPSPFAPVLEQAYMPNRETILAAARDLLGS